MLLRLKHFEKTDSRRSHLTDEWKTKNRRMVSEALNLLNQSAEMCASVRSGSVAEGKQSIHIISSVYFISKLILKHH